MGMRGDGDRHMRVSTITSHPTSHIQEHAGDAVRKCTGTPTDILGRMSSLYPQYKFKGIPTGQAAATATTAPPTKPEEPSTQVHDAWQEVQEVQDSEVACRLQKALSEGIPV